MQVSEQIIEVLNYLCEKVGIAIDWTSDNIFPQLTEFISRYTTYNIVAHCVWVAFSVVVLIISAALYKKLYNAYKSVEVNKRSNLFFYTYSTYSGEEKTKLRNPGIIYVIAVSFLTFVFLIALFYNINAMIEWIFIPEVNIVKELKYLMQ